METSLRSSDLQEYLANQIRSLIPDGLFQKQMVTIQDIDITLDKCEYCFSHIKNSAFSDDTGKTFFSHVHADQYAMFLVYLSNHVWKTQQNIFVCDRIMYVNRVLHSFMMSYKAKIPDIFWLAHPVGSVIGNADYSNYLYISQNCTINTGAPDSDGSLRPKIGKCFTMGAGAALIGTSEIGNRCSLGVNVLLYDQTLLDDSIVINDNGMNRIVVKNNGSCFSDKIFRNIV